jgi:hypothetical protein
MLCESCGYARKVSETQNEPVWQCPNCFKAYNKTEVVLEPVYSKEELNRKNTVYLKETNDELSDNVKILGIHTLIKYSLIGSMFFVYLEGSSSAQFFWGIVFMGLSVWLASDVKDMLHREKVYAIEKDWSYSPGYYTRKDNPFAYYLYLLLLIGLSTGSFIFGAYKIVRSIS